MCAAHSLGVEHEHRRMWDRGMSTQNVSCSRDTLSTPDPTPVPTGSVSDVLGFLLRVCGSCIPDKGSRVPGASHPTLRVALSTVYRSRNVGIQN